MACFLTHFPETTITIPRNSALNGITYFDIEINVGQIRWTVRHRYSEFVELNDKLVAGQSISKDLLPPKKVIGNKSPQFLEQRRRQLETYLQHVLKFLQFTMCREFVEFLNFNKYDIIYLLQDLAAEIYQNGDLLLANASHCYELSALDMFAISERRKIPCPNTDAATKKIYDFSHIVDFCLQLKHLLIQPRKVSQSCDDEIVVKKSFASEICVLRMVHSHFSQCMKNIDQEPTISESMEVNTSYGSSNIVPDQLKFDFNAFKSLKNLQIYGISCENIVDVSSIRETVASLTIRYTNTKQLNQIILCDCIHRDYLDRTKEWPNLIEADFACNELTSIDCSVQLLPNLTRLNLNRNQISSISYLNCLPFLRVLNLSQNLISECVDCHLDLGNLVELNLSQNRLKSLEGLRKMYSLITLNVSCNIIVDIDEVDHVAGLPCLEELILTGNPVAGIVDYRHKVLSRFGDRCGELYLDNEKAGSNEIDMALVLAALRQSAPPPPQLTRANTLTAVSQSVLNSSSSSSSNMR